MSNFDITKFQHITKANTQFESIISANKAKNLETQQIEDAVSGSIENIKNGSKAFVIYGDPQSGKTGMMIALTAKLLDEGHKLVVILVNDSLPTLNQNLNRFTKAGIKPAPKNIIEIANEKIAIGNNEWIIFSKKNAGDLKKLNIKLKGYSQKVIIDDEADYATPNAKVNKGGKTKINELIHELKGDEGIYIGVTATPARLDLNNTFNNNHDIWVAFNPHSKYRGQDIFFPLNFNDLQLGFRLTFLSSEQDSAVSLRTALFGFFVNVADLNLNVNEANKKNYSMLIHTSGKMDDHDKDFDEVNEVFNILRDSNSENYNEYVKELWDMASERYGNDNADKITSYILENIAQNKIVKMNSEKKDKSISDYQIVQDPQALFTIAIGGNTVSRGVTFDNLLSMYFTRDVKSRLQQDTYVQRARMFGARENLEHFELSIPEDLYIKWHQSFIFHKLVLEAMRKGKGIPVWLENNRIAVAASASIDKSRVYIDRGQMSYAKFSFNLEEYNKIFLNESLNSIEKLEKINQLVGEDALPKYLLDFIKSNIGQNIFLLAVHEAKDIESYKDSDTEKIERAKGLIGNFETRKFPKATHHIKVFYNKNNEAKVFYRYKDNIRFLKNMKDSFKEDQ